MQDTGFYNWRILAIATVLMAGSTALQAGGLQPAPQDQPMVLQFDVLPDQRIDAYEVIPIDLDTIRAEDEVREQQGEIPRFALPHAVYLTPSDSGTWETLPNGMRLWRLRISVPGATSINLGFTKYKMPPGGRLSIYSADLSTKIRPFTDRDNHDHEQLWTPIVPGDLMVVELALPADVEDQLKLELTAINQGYRGFGTPDLVGDPTPRSGSCNVDVVCPEGDDWRVEIPAIGVYTRFGSFWCTGSMINNTSQDETPYFLTADHCSMTGSAATSIVVYWNYETSVCGGTPDGSFNQFTSGSVARATSAASDFTLLELNSPPDPGWGVTYAGWDRSGNDASSAVAIHHPSTDEKKISFEFQPTTTTDYLSNTVNPNASYIRVADWDLGTTEPGSSGSPLFDPNHHIIGALTGGFAACGNNDSDWYGRFSKSWTGGGSSSTRLSNWLDPIATGQIMLDTLLPGATGLRVTPNTNLDSSGDPGGPFSPSSIIYTLENLGASSIGYSVTESATWLSVSNAGGNIAPGSQTTVGVSINSNANSLSQGTYQEVVSFVNTTTGEGNTTRTVMLSVGGPQPIYTWDMNSSPAGWTTEGQWAWGTPTGAGAGSGGGGPDPTSGFSGSNVFGYNLNGNYTNNMPEYDLTTGVIDCSDIQGTSLRFRRWLNVEQSAYDHAYIRISVNGGPWTNIWQNSTEVADFAWQLMEYDISAQADNQPNVRIRWIMGTTDDSWLYSGWNLDDVEIWGIDTTPTATCNDGIQNQGEDRIDCGGPCAACECASDLACDDGDFCNGVETCDAFGNCVPGSDPCPGQFCHADSSSCFSCPPADGDMDDSGNCDGDDIQLFVDAVMGSPEINDICHGDFLPDGQLDFSDVDGMVASLLAP